MSAPESSKSTENAPTTTVVTGQWNKEEWASYLAPRVVWSATIASILGASRGYYLGTGVFLPMYGYAIGAGVFGGSFFSLNYALRTYRQVDDWTNFAASGAINGALAGALQSRRSSLVMGLFGGFGGALYRIGSTLAYDVSRDLWVDGRRFTIHESKRKILINNHRPSDLQKLPQILAESEERDRQRAAWRAQQTPEASGKDSKK